MKRRGHDEGKESVAPEKSLHGFRPDDPLTLKGSCRRSFARVGDRKHPPCRDCPRRAASRAPWAASRRHARHDYGVASQEPANPRRTRPREKRGIYTVKAIGNATDVLHAQRIL